MPEPEKPVEEEEVVEGDDMPKAFEEAMTKIETENKVEPKVEPKVETPAGEVIEKEIHEGDDVPVVDESLVETPAGEDIPAEDAAILENADSEVLEYCRNYFGDDDKVVQAIKLSPNLFDEVREILDEEKTKETKPAEAGKPEVKEPVVDEVDALIAKLDPDVHGQEITDILKSMAERQKQGTKVLTEEQEKLQAERNEAFNIKVDTIFDGHAKKFPELGNSAKITRSSQELRSDVFAVAMALAQRRNKSPEAMLGKAIELFKNQGGEKVAEQKVIDKLNKQEKTTTNPPTRRRSEKAPTYSDEYDKAEAIMEAAEQKAGLTT